MPLISRSSIELFRLKGRQIIGHVAWCLTRAKPLRDVSCSPPYLSKRPFVDGTYVLLEASVPGLDQILFSTRDIQQRWTRSSSGKFSMDNVWVFMPVVNADPHLVRC